MATVAFVPAAPVVVVPTLTVLVGSVTAVVPTPRLSCWPLRVSTLRGRDASLPLPSMVTWLVVFLAAAKDDIVTMPPTVRLPPKVPSPEMRNEAFWLTEV